MLPLSEIVISAISPERMDIVEPKPKLIIESPAETMISTSGSGWPRRRAMTGHRTRQAIIAIEKISQPQAQAVRAM